MEQNKAMFGISVFKRSITNDIIASIAEFMNDSFRESMIILVDEPEGHNWRLRGRNSKKHALQVVSQVSNERVNAIQNVLKRKSINTIPVTTWNAISKQKKYRENLLVVQKFYKDNSEFKNDLIEKMRAYHSINFMSVEHKLNRKMKQSELDEIANFLLEEIAGLAFLHFHLGFSNDVYPDENNALINAIFSGEKYHELTRKLGVKASSYKYIIHPKPAV